MDGEEENVGPFRRTSARTRRMATRMASALASSDNRAQVLGLLGDPSRFRIHPTCHSTEYSCLPASPFLRLEIIPMHYHWCLKEIISTLL
jgi:hypothetical protein